MILATNLASFTNSSNKFLRTLSIAVRTNVEIAKINGKDDLREVKIDATLRSKRSLLLDDLSFRKLNRHRRATSIVG